ncbi:hypothetical protein EVAR_32327_1 [Eumeta japonica]|uniref:Uncharacterized protein n=1 Tax=Eumeta variegata TaxID=151549 RepID=A0A4C1Z7A7_EUMVA|nr:hypothetical protein EVAR_32327_1 [Eumeta japonica]
MYTFFFFDEKYLYARWSGVNPRRLKIQETLSFGLRRLRLALCAESKDSVRETNSGATATERADEILGTGAALSRVGDPRLRRDPKHDPEARALLRNTVNNRTVTREIIANALDNISYGALPPRAARRPPPSANVGASCARFDNISLLHLPQKDSALKEDYGLAKEGRHILCYGSAHAHHSSRVRMRACYRIHIITDQIHNPLLIIRAICFFTFDTSLEYVTPKVA